MFTVIHETKLYEEEVIHLSITPSRLPRFHPTIPALRNSESRSWCVLFQTILLTHAHVVMQTCTYTAGFWVLSGVFCPNKENHTLYVIL